MIVQVEVVSEVIEVAVIDGKPGKDAINIFQGPIVITSAQTIPLDKRTVYYAPTSNASPVLLRNDVPNEATYTLVNESGSVAFNVAVDSAPGSTLFTVQPNTTIVIQKVGTTWRLVFRSGGTSGGGTSGFAFYRPGGVDSYFRPDGTSIYLRA